MSWRTMDRPSLGSAPPVNEAKEIPVRRRPGSTGAALQHNRNPAWIAVVVALLTTGALTMPARAAGEAHQGSIQISYEVPKDPALKNAYDIARGANALEMLRLILLPFKLPEDLYIKAVSCNGIPNAYFFREDDKPTIRICYEYLRSVRETIPKEPTPEGITPREAFVGQLLFTIAHEFGHAAFDIYNLPVLGRQEDAADQFAAWLLLQFGGERAHRVIRGAAWAYNQYFKNLKDNPKVTVPLAALSSDHGTPAQRFYNLACISYGYDAKVFAVVVERGYLPAARAKVCEYEYSNLSYAIKTLIGPHMDKELADKVMAISWFSPPDARALDDWAP